MSDEEKKNKSGLVSSGNRGLATRSSGLARRGLELLSSQQGRIIYFPADRSIGTLYVLDLYDPDSDWEELGEALGSIKVPMGKDLHLYVSKEAVTGFSPLSKLKPNDLQSLHLPTDISDAELIHIQGLTGLRSLHISRNQITDAV